MTIKESLIKIEENVYEIPKQGKMLIPGRIFVSAKMLDDLEENAIQQVANVAMLPKLEKYSIGMPDIHSGYGFSIGGVAASDSREGIISPGGIGFDINCLTGDTKILTEFGNSIKIEDFEQHQSEMEIEQNGRKIKQIRFLEKLPTLNVNNKTIENKRINLFMSRESNEIYEVTLNSGLKINATKEHPFLTKNGMKPLFELRENEELAVSLFEGIEEKSTISEKEAITIKILGYMFGDGCLYESNGILHGSVYGTEEDLKTMKEDLRKINVNSNIYSRKRNHIIKTKYKIVNFNTINHELHIHSKEFNEMLRVLGMPLGNKTRQETKIPDWIKNSNKTIKRLFLAGFFGAEMSSPKSSSKTCFYCPTVDQNKSERYSQNARDFFIDICLMLEDFEIKNTRITEIQEYYENKYNEKTKRFRLMISAEKDMLKLWRNIGFE